MSEEITTPEAVETPVVESAENVTPEASAETIENEVQEAIEDGATQEEVANMIRKYELKVNGKTIEKEIDLSDEAAVIEQLQLAAAGRGAMQNNAELERNFEEYQRQVQEGRLLSGLRARGFGPFLQPLHESRRQGSWPGSR